VINPGAIHPVVPGKSNEQQVATIGYDARAIDEIVVVSPLKK
jgi:hypothetical protein